MRCERVCERVPVKCIVAVHANIECAIAQRTGNTQQDVSIAQLLIVERNSGLLMNLTIDQFRGA